MVLTTLVCLMCIGCVCEYMGSNCGVSVFVCVYAAHIGDVSGLVCVVCMVRVWCVYRWRCCCECGMYGV